MLVLREKAITTIRSLVIPELCWLRHLFFIELIVFPVKKKIVKIKKSLAGLCPHYCQGSKDLLSICNEALQEPKVPCRTLDISIIEMGVGFD